MDVPPDAFLAAYPDGIREVADRLRALVREVVPDATERVRLGWRLIGFDRPHGRRSVYFAYVAPEPVHVHLGFPDGISLADPRQLLQGAHLGLRQVRYLTYLPGDSIREREVRELVREAARVALLPRAERLALALEQRETGGSGKRLRGERP